MSGRAFRFPVIVGGCRVRECVWMAHACPHRWHRLLNVVTLRGGRW